MPTSTQLDKKRYLRNFRVNGCTICGYKRCISAIAIHHMNPKLSNAKDGDTIKYLMKCAWWKLGRELKNCIPVCHNCHSEIHEGYHSEYLVEEEVDGCEFRDRQYVMF